MEIYHTATQKLSLSKTLVFSLKILTLNSYDLFRLVEEEALCNPALVFLNQKKLTSHFSSQEFIAQDEPDNHDTLLCTLDEQIRNSSFNLEKKEFLLNVLHNFLDEKFFLKKEPFLNKYSSKKHYNWLAYFKHAIPPGIAACNLQERFKHQLEFYNLKGSLAYQVIDECWKHFLSKKHLKIQCLLKRTETEIQQAIQQIKKNCKLNIVECALYQNLQTFNHPDIILKADGTLELNEYFIPKIKINENFIHLSHSINEKMPTSYIKDRIKQAKNIILAIKKRNETLLSIAQIAINFQNQSCARSVFSSKKLTLKDISLKTNLSQSTISRALKNKSVLTSNGIKMIGDFLQCRAKN